MIFQRLEVWGLAHNSYVVGCEKSKEVVVVDPERNIDRYLDLQNGGLAIRAVLETHIHADYASGARDLAALAGAELMLSAYDHGEQYEVAYPHRELRDGDRVTVGSVMLQARHTPGHTPEHLSFVVYDRARSETVPMLMLSGDFLFVGSVGRPDLLGEAAMRGLADQLYDSVAAMSDLPDGLEIHPGHGAASMCGSGIGGREVSTLGYERIANPFLAAGIGREAFVSRLLGSRPPRPAYYLRMKELNSRGPAALASLPVPSPLELESFVQRMADHLVLDMRPPTVFAEGHIPGSLSIGVGANVAPWAAWTVPPDQPILLVGGKSSEETAVGAVEALRRIGLDGADGLLAGGFETWKQSGRPVQQTAQVTPDELERQMAAGAFAQVLDIRTDHEFAAGHIPGVSHFVGTLLAEHLEQIPRSGRVAVVCGSGYRSNIVAGFLQRAGFEEVVNVAGGMTAWQRLGLPVDHGAR